MSDSFEFTLHDPLTKEDWDKISDAEYENTMYVTFQTPQGRQVKYIKCDIFDKIRAEIADLEEGISIYHNDRPWVFKDEVLQIIDKYRASTGQDNIEEVQK